MDNKIIAEFPIKEEVVNGEEMVTMHQDDFVKFFEMMISYRGDIDDVEANELVKDYREKSKIKRKRIRNKKQKEVLKEMSYQLFSEYATSVDIVHKNWDKI